jgi:hypothetical protein
MMDMMGSALSKHTTGVSNGWGKQKPESNLWSRSNVGSNLMFALEQKPVSDLWSRIYMNRSPSGIGSISVSVRGRTQGSPPTFIFGHSLKKYTITDLVNNNLKYFL